MRKSTNHRPARLAFLCALTALPLSACGDHMVFAERAGFSIASVNLGEQADRPINVQVGFEHRLLAIAPPIGGVSENNDGQRKANGEATSLISGFEMSYEPGDGFLLPGQTAINTQFASGNAAVALSKKSPQAAMALMKAQSSRAWFSVDGSATMTSLAHQITNAEKDRGQLANIRVQDDETVFEIRRGEPPSRPIKLTIDQATINKLRAEDTAATGKALIEGQEKTVTAYREGSLETY